MTFPPVLGSALAAALREPCKTRHEKALADEVNRMWRLLAKWRQQASLVMAHELDAVDEETKQLLAKYENS